MTPEEAYPRDASRCTRSACMVAYSSAAQQCMRSSACAVPRVHGRFDGAPPRTGGRACEGHVPFKARAERPLDDDELARAHGRSAAGARRPGA
eukprot:scaffold106453_cov42-Phaeocystis_antarctica.AAC.1